MEPKRLLAPRRKRIRNWTQGGSPGDGRDSDEGEGCEARRWRAAGAAISARAELVCEGKYDAAGRRVAPLRAALPFQTVETVNESAQDRQGSLQFGPGFRAEESRNRLIWIDKKYVLPSLLAEFAGKVNLIDIDPPFDTVGKHSDAGIFSRLGLLASLPKRPATLGRA